MDTLGGKGSSLISEKSELNLLVNLCSVGRLISLNNTFKWQ